MTAVTGTIGVGQGTAEAERRANGLTLKAEDFLQLLAAQLRYQNPLEPLDNVQFMTQLTQFAMLQELVDLKGELQKAKEDLQRLQQAVEEEKDLSRALSLVGLEVTVRGEDGTREGVVTGVRLVNGVPYLLLGEVTAALDDVLEVRQPLNSGSSGPGQAQNPGV